MKQRKSFRLGDLLIQVGAINEAQLMEGLRYQKIHKMHLGDSLKELGYITQRQIIEVLEFQLGIPQVDLEKTAIDADVPLLISEDFARNNTLIPIKKVDKTLHVAMEDPLNLIVINDIEIVTGLTVEPRIASGEQIISAINTHFNKKVAEEAIEAFAEEYQEYEEKIDQNIIREINKAPVVRLVNTIIVQAAQNRASDIHIEPQEETLRVRFRVDGDLQEVMHPAKQTHGAVITRIKIMAKLNIAERRIPQDGRIELNVQGRDLDIRVSTLPTIYGEKVVMRMLDRSQFLRKYEELGLNTVQQKMFAEIIKSRNGIILVTGPTGSGKSTTLYALLNELNDSRRNVSTVEDPVEYRMAGLAQSQVNPKAGFDFASGLRSLLRQDPDVIMVGEIRDKETAEMAVRAGITGHLVLSTLHTNSAAQTINRLVDMGMEKFLLASSLVAVIAQTLVKRICPKCRKAYKATDAQRDIIGVKNDELILYTGEGCSYCKGAGTLGRIAVYEIMKLDHGIRKMIINDVDPSEVKKYMRQHGMKSLSENCRDLLVKGITTYEEYLRISYSLEGK